MKNQGIAKTKGELCSNESCGHIQLFPPGPSPLTNNTAEDADWEPVGCLHREKQYFIKYKCKLVIHAHKYL